MIVIRERDVPVMVLVAALCGVVVAAIGYMHGQHSVVDRNRARMTFNQAGAGMTYDLPNHPWCGPMGDL